MCWADIEGKDQEHGSENPPGGKLVWLKGCLREETSIVL